MAAQLPATRPDLQLRADNPAMASPSGSPRALDGATTGVPVLTTIVLFVVVALLLVFIVWK